MRYRVLQNAYNSLILAIWEIGLLSLKKYNNYLCNNIKSPDWLQANNRNYLKKIHSHCNIRPHCNFHTSLVDPAYFRSCSWRNLGPEELGLPLRYVTSHPHGAMELIIIGLGLQGTIPTSKFQRKSKLQYFIIYILLTFVYYYHSFGLFV